MRSKNKRLEDCLSSYSEDGNVTMDKHGGHVIYQFDLLIDNSDNKWGEVQPKVSAVSVRGGRVESYNIRLGEFKSENQVDNIRDMVFESKPPCIDKFDTGHSDSVIQPHIRMNDDTCSINDFIEFINRMMERLG